MNNLNILNVIIKYICINIINILITNYVDFKVLIVNIYEIYRKKLFKKLFYEIINTIIKDIIYEKNKLVLIYNVILYMLKKYILNYSFIELCLHYILNLDVTNLNLHIKDKLDLCSIFKHIIKKIFIFLKTLLIYIIERYYYEYNEIHFFLQFMRDKNVRSVIHLENVLIRAGNITDLIMYNRELRILVKCLYCPKYRFSLGSEFIAGPE